MALGGVARGCEEQRRCLGARGVAHSCCMSDSTAGGMTMAIVAFSRACRVSTWQISQHAQCGHSSSIFLTMAPPHVLTWVWVEGQNIVWVDDEREPNRRNLDD